jgi:translation initiation factor 6
MERTVSFGGDPHIGVFSRIFEDVAIVPPDTPEEFSRALSEALSVEIVETTIQGSSIIGSLATGNQNGFVVSGLASADEIATLKRFRDVYLLSDTMNAAGNVLLVNDRILVHHPDLPEKVVGEISDFLDVPAVSLTLGGIKTVGMAAVATSRGIMVHPRSSDNEMNLLAEKTDLPVGKGTVTMGSGLVGAGLIANGSGYLAGLGTTGFELGRIEDIFGFFG